MLGIVWAMSQIKEQCFLLNKVGDVQCPFRHSYNRGWIWFEFDLIEIDVYLFYCKFPKL